VKGLRRQKVVNIPTSVGESNKNMRVVVDKCDHMFMECPVWCKKAFLHLINTCLFSARFVPQAGRKAKGFAVQKTSRRNDHRWLLSRIAGPQLNHDSVK
jgi:hypothetical protein